MICEETEMNQYVSDLHCNNSDILKCGIELNTIHITNQDKNNENEVINA